MKKAVTVYEVVENGRFNDYKVVGYKVGNNFVDDITDCMVTNANKSSIEFDLDANNLRYSHYLKDTVGGVYMPDTTAIIKALQEPKIQMLKVAYNNRISANIKYMGVMFQADKPSRDLIVAALSAGVLPVGFFWKSLEAKIPMTYIQLQGLAGVILVRGQIAFTRLQDKKQEVRELTTLEAIDAISWD